MRLLKGNALVEAVSFYRYALLWTGFDDMLSASRNNSINILYTLFSDIPA